MRRLAHLVVVAVSAGSLLAASCSSDGGDSSAASATGPAGDTTTTASPPIILATIADLSLPIGDCWNEMAVASSTTTTTPLITSSTESTLTTEPPTTRTTVPRAKVVAIVDCSGTNQGQVYSSFCIGADPLKDEEVESAVGAQTADALQKVPCPGDSELAWPGDREVRRAAARVCLETFSQVFGEVYAVSDRVAAEITPNQGLWGQGERRIVCSATQPSVTTTTTSGG